MQRAHVVRMLEQLRRDPAGAPRLGAPVTLSADRYRDAAWCERERAMLAGQPRVLAASAAVAPGACVPVDLPGLSVVLTRTPDGKVRGFKNACRHRGTRLVDEPCARRAMVCPYHAWTYDLTGALVHVPHTDMFAGVELGQRGLVAVPVSERHGLIWLGAEVDERLGAIGEDLAALGLERHVQWARGRATRRCNWKLVVEAFLDGYHIRVLHRDSVYRFFLDAASLAEPVGRHIRAVTARRTFRDAPADLDAVAVDELRSIATPSLFVFPATIVVEHPDFVSIMTVHPMAPDLTDWDHLMLVPADRAGEAEHWTRSWQLIEEGVFQGEDLWVCEQAQRSIDSGATDEMLFGSLELAAAWFHQSLADAGAGAGA